MFSILRQTRIYYIVLYMYDCIGPTFHIVDSGFRHFIHFHFCYKVSTVGRFKIGLLIFFAILVLNTASQTKLT